MAKKKAAKKAVKTAKPAANKGTKTKKPVAKPKAKSAAKKPAIKKPAPKVKAKPLAKKPAPKKAAKPAPKKPASKPVATKPTPKKATVKLAKKKPAPKPRRSQGLFGLFKKKDQPAAVSTPAAAPAHAAAAVPAGMTFIENRENRFFDDGPKIRTVPIFKLNDRPGYFFRASMNVDADGAPKCYHPTNDSLALDDLDNSTANSRVFVQNIPFPGKKLGLGPADGFYVSQTSLNHGSESRCDSFVDAVTIPYVVMPSGFHDLSLGACGVIFNTQNQKLIHIIFADTNKRVGEASMRAASKLGFPNKSPRNGVDEAIFIYLIFPDATLPAESTAPHWPDSKIENKAMAAFEAWGGMARMTDVASKI